VLLALVLARIKHHRGFIGSWPHLGVPAGLFLANLAVLAFSTLSGPQFLVWGWRVPFLLSGVLVAVGLYIRVGILETPVFARLAAERRIERAPVVEALRRQPREIVLTALCRMGEQAPFYIATAFVFAYGTGTLQLRRDFLLTAVLTATVISFVMTPLAGHLSDRFGRKRIYMIGAALTGLYGFVYFGLLDTRTPALVFLAIALSLIPHDLMYGPQAALIAEAFPGRVRYSGASLGYQLSSVFAGGPAPLVATWLFARYHSGWAIAAFILFCAVVSLASTALLPDYTNRDTREH
jgi:MFS family permease